jgi:hypothetical protein
MGWQLRKSKKIGPLRLTASKSGVSMSAGAPGARVSVNSKGQARRTVGIPGSGVYSTQRIDNQGGGPVEGGRVQLSVQDVTGGSRRMFEGDPNVECCSVVQLDYQPDEAAQLAGIIGQPSSDKPRGIRDCVLMPSDDGHYYVALYVTHEDNPDLFGRKSMFRGPDLTPKGIPLGRLRVSDTRKHQDLFAGRPIKCLIFIDATEEGSDGFQVRFRSDLIDPPEAQTT